MNRLADRWVVLIGLMVARISFGFSFQVVPTVAPGIAEQMDLDALAIGTLVGLFMLPGFFLALPGGLFAQWVGERRVLVFGLIGMSGGALLCATAGTYEALWIGRLVSGIAGILVTVVMTKLVVDWFAGKELATAMGLFLGGYPAGIGLALVALGPFAEPGQWHIAFFACAALCASGLIVFLVTERTKPAVPPQANPGAARLHSKDIFRITAAASVVSLYNAGYLIMLGFVPLYLVSEGHSPAVAATVMGAGVWVSILAVPLGGALADKLGRPNLFIGVAATFWTCGMLFVPSLSDSPGWLAALFALTSLIGAAPVGSMTALGAEVMRPEIRGSGMGVFYTWFYGGAAAGPALAGYVVDLTSPESAIYLVSACGVGAIVCLGGFRLVQRLT
jgi:MFS family permease